MIKFDGDRSKKRVWFAEKQLSIIKEIDVPAKTLIFDGFKINVKQCDDLTSGDIKAPMGAVVLMSNTDGIKVAVADYWAGGCTACYDLHVLFSYNERIALISGEQKEEMDERGFQTVRFRPVPQTALYWPPSGSTVTVPQTPSTPSIFPYKGAEAFTITVTDDLWVDFNGDGYPDFWYPLLDSSLTFYSSNGSNLGGRRTVSVSAGANNIWKTCQNMPGGDKTLFAEAYYDLIEGQFACAAYYSDTTDSDTGKIIPTVHHVFLSDIVPEVATPHSMPAELRAYMLNTAISIIRPLGSYSFVSSSGQKVFVSAAIFAPTAIPIGGNNFTIENYFSTHPEEEKWRMFLSVTVGEAVYLINSSQFYATLQALAVNPFSVSGVTDWSLVEMMMLYLFPWPNLPGLTNIYFAWKPHDSIMFHGHDDAVYTWTRSAGSVKFDTTGMHIVSLMVPHEVADVAGTRPDITHAGNGLYICVCNKIQDRVSAVYYGSPFSGWTRLPDVPANCYLVHARPALANEDKIHLLGVVVESRPEEADRYRLAQLSFKYRDEESWQIMTVLPYPVRDDSVFTVGLFGDDPEVKSLNDYPSPPPANPQNIVIPYDGYARFRP